MTVADMIRKIDVWNAGNYKVPVFEFLYISKKEYDLWLTDNVVPKLYNKEK